jgi:hypothetical protein
MAVLITSHASFLKTANIIDKQQSATNNGREPLTLDDISVPSSARTDPGPRIPKQHKDTNSVASAPPKLTTNIDHPSVDSVVLSDGWDTNHPSVDSVVSSDDWGTDRIDPSVVDAQQEIINCQEQQIQELAAQQQENQKTIGQLAAQQQEYQETIGQLLMEQQSFKTIIDQQQTELFEKQEAAHAQQVQLIQIHNEDVAKLLLNKDEMMAIIESQHAGLEERDSLLKGQQIEHAERLVQIAMAKMSEAKATSPKNTGDNKDNNSKSEDEDVTHLTTIAKHEATSYNGHKPTPYQGRLPSGRNQHNNRNKNQKGKIAKHKDESPDLKPP